MTRYGMLIDAGTCAGCNACTMACKYQNATPSGIYWCKVRHGRVRDSTRTRDKPSCP